MKSIQKELSTHLISLIVFFGLIALLFRWFNLNLLYFFIGGLLGTFLPDLDHFIYTQITSPNELTSQRVSRLLEQKEYRSALDLLVKTRHERKMPVFHTALFQLVFGIFAFFVISSNNSPFGQGLVLGILLHLLVDQAKDFFELGRIKNWFVNLSLNTDRNLEAYFIFLNAVILLLLALFM